MNTTTLRGIFPDPKPVHRRNFMRENVKQIKKMQGLVQPDPESQSTLTKTRNRAVPTKVSSNLSAVRGRAKLDLKKRPLSVLPAKIPSRFKRDFEYKTTNRGVQTERPEDILKLYETGVLKYPSQQSNVSPGSDKKSPKRAKESGDSPIGSLDKNFNKLGLDEKHDHIKNNIKNIKQKMKLEEQVDPNLPPPNYQKGAVPKYLKEKREDELKSSVAEGDSCAGLVLLPDEERKEYLRVARENYAALIKELNSMPVRNDTLKRMKRKIAIEDELKRLDEVIKIFQKPKVFVKAD